MWRRHDLQNHTLIAPNLRLVVNLYAHIDQFTGSAALASVSKIHCRPPSDVVIKYHTQATARHIF